MLAQKSDGGGPGEAAGGAEAFPAAQLFHQLGRGSSQEEGDGEDGDRGQESSGQTGHAISDVRRQDQHRTGRGVGEPDSGGEVVRGEPARLGDRDSLHEGKGRLSSAECDSSFPARRYIAAASSPRTATRRPISAPPTQRA